MLIKTHLAITLFFTLLLLPYVNFPVLFLVVSLFATYLPDIDSKHSRMGHHWFLRPIQWFARHRGMAHSFTFLLTLTLVLVLFIPIVALGFFLGYSSHLLADSFTIEGIRPFYPSKKFSSGNIITGSISETNVFVFFLILDVILFFIRGINVL